MTDVGDVLILTADIYDDGEDHHPPGYIARRGERVVVRKVLEGGRRRLAVSHLDCPRRRVQDRPRW